MFNSPLLTSAVDTQHYTHYTFFTTHYTQHYTAFLPIFTLQYIYYKIINLFSVVCVVSYRLFIQEWSEKKGGISRPPFCYQASQRVGV